MPDGDVTISVALDTKEVKARIAELTKDLEQMLKSSNGGALTQDLKDIMSTLSAVTKKVEQVTAAMSKMESGGNTGSSQYQQAQAKLEGYASTLAVANARVKSHALTSQKYGSKIISSLSRIRKAASRSLNFNSAKIGIRRLAQLVFGVYSVTAMLNKLKSAIKTGINNLVQFQSETNATNQAMTELKTSLLFIQNAWGAAFAPVINVVQPILTSLMDTFAEVGNAVARFFGALTGQQQVIQALRVSTGDYAKSLKSAGGAVKQLQDRLAGFDDLNVLGKDSEGGGGGGVSVPDPSEMFEYVEATSSFAEMLKNAWADQDFTGVGENIKNKIIDVLNGINWTDIQSKVTQGATFAGQFLVGLFGDPELFTTAGHAIGEGFNTVNLGIASFLDEVEKIPLGENLGAMLNEFLKTADFETAGDNINRVITGIINNIDEFVKTIDDEELAKAIEEFINGLDVGEIVATAANCVLDVTKLLINVTADLMVDWGTSLGDDWWKKASEGIESSLDGQSITLDTGVDATENPLTALVDTWLIELGEHTWKGSISIAEFFTGEDISEVDSLNGALDALWGPSRRDEIRATSETISRESSLTTEDMQFLGESFTNLGTTIGDFFSSIPEKAEEFSLSLSEKWETIKHNASETWENIKSTASEKWTDFKSTVTTKAQEIKDNVTEKVTALKDKLSETWQNIKDTAYEKFVAMRVAIVDAFNVLKEALKGPINAIIGVIEGMVNFVIRGINKLTGGINEATAGLGDVASKVGLPTITIPAISEVSLPRLAQGAVIPPNKEFMAVLGDQSSGTNIEAPLDTIKQAVADVLGDGNAEMIQLLQQLIAVVESKNLTIGDKEIGRANARYAQQQNRIRGVGF